MSVSGGEQAPYKLHALNFLLTFRTFRCPAPLSWSLVRLPDSFYYTVTLVATNLLALSVLRPFCASPGLPLCVRRALLIIVRSFELPHFGPLWR